MTICSLLKRIRCDIKQISCTTTEINTCYPQSGGARWKIGWLWCVWSRTLRDQFKMPRNWEWKRTHILPRPRNVLLLPRIRWKLFYDFLGGLKNFFWKWYLGVFWSVQEKGNSCETTGQWYKIKVYFWPPLRNRVAGKVFLCACFKRCWADP